MLEPGSIAPSFTVVDEEGATISLEDLRGHWVLLWWYPKADTPG